jgi:hypothetical protein
LCESACRCIELSGCGKLSGAATDLRGAGVSFSQIPVLYGKSKNHCCTEREPHCTDRSCVHRLILFCFGVEGANRAGPSKLSLTTGRLAMSVCDPCAVNNTAGDLPWPLSVKLMPEDEERRQVGSAICIAAFVSLLFSAAELYPKSTRSRFPRCDTRVVAVVLSRNNCARMRCRRLTFS